MKKYLSTLLGIVFSISMILSCTTEDEPEETKKTEQQSEAKNEPEKENSEKETKTTPKITFDFSNANAIAKLEHASSSSRAAAESENLGDFVKILSDGTLKNAITMANENGSLSDIAGIYKSPLSDSKDIFVVFYNTSFLGSEYDEKQGAITYSHIGQLVCVHEDGSVADILYAGSIYSGQYKTYVKIKPESVQFDVNGNLYFIAEKGYNFKGESTVGEVIYQFNSVTNEITEMVAAVENTEYYKLQIDKTGMWIFTSGLRSSSYFLRAISISNPNSPVNIFYSSNYRIYSDNWVYNDESGIMYFIAKDGNDDGLFTATKNGGFKDKKFMRTYLGEGLDCELVESFQGFEYSYWNSNVMTAETFDASKAVQCILDGAGSWMECDYSNYETTGESEWKQFKLTTDMVDIRFDKFADEKNKQLRAIYIISQGRKNEEAVKLFDNNFGRTVWYWDNFPERYLSKTTAGKTYCENNFLADILYVKDSDTLLKDSDEVLFSYMDSTGIVHKTRGCDIFTKNAFGYESNGLINLCTVSGNTQYLTFAFAAKFYENNIFDSKALLDWLFNFCNVEGIKEFRLDSFRDDEIYEKLYTPLKDEKALEWLFSDIERMNLLGKMFIHEKNYSYNKNTETVHFSPNYTCLMTFLQKTCFIADTDTKAVKWNDDMHALLSYSGSINVSIPHFCGITNLSVNKDGVFGICTNVLKSYNTITAPYFYIIQIADNTGKLVEMQNKLPLPSGKVVNSRTDSGLLVLQYSLMSESGAELGYHHIYVVDMADGKVTNCFDNVPNRNRLEVVSFSATEELLYYSAVRGTTIENGIVNIATNEYNPLPISRKMEAVYTF